MLYDKFGWNWPSVSEEGDFQIFFPIILTISQVSPLGEGHGPSFIHLESHILKNALCQVWFDFKNKSYNFYYFTIISSFPWRRAWPFVCTNLNPFYSRMLYAKFGWNWLSGSGEEDTNVKRLWQQQWQFFIRKAHFSIRLRWSTKKPIGHIPHLKMEIFKFLQCIFAISILSCLGKECDPSSEQNWISFPQVCFVPSLVEIGPVVLERKIFKFPKSIFDISLLCPLQQGSSPSFQQTWIPFPQGFFVPSLVEKCQLFWRRRWKCEEKFTDRRTDDGQVIRKLTWAFRSGKLKMKSKQQPQWRTNFD